MLTPEQLLKRRDGIGGSDAAPIAGVSKWKTPVQVYLEKTSDIISEVTSPVMERGSVLEPFVRSLFSRQIGKEVRTPTQTIKAEKKNFMLANVDGYLSDEKAIVELKTCNVTRKGEWGEVFTDQIPDDYLTQVHHYLSVVPKMNKAYVVVLFGSEDFLMALKCLVARFGVQEMLKALEKTEFDLRIFEVHRNQPLEKRLVEIEEDFWFNHVQKGVSPPWHTREDLLALFPRSQEKDVRATEEDLEAISFISEKSREVKEIEAQIEEKKAYLCGRLGESSYLRDAEGHKLASWKNQDRTVFDKKEFTEKYPDLAKVFSVVKQSRVLRV